MKIIVSKNSGYCYGVKNAIKLAQENVKKNNKLYSLGSIIHNKRAIKKLEENGLITVDRLQMEFKNVIFRSHGVEKKFYEYANDNNIQVIDATCIFVKKIHEIVNENFARNKEIIIVGDKKHPEVIGINSWCEYNAQFIENIDDIEKLTLDASKYYCVVFQTTFNVEKFEKIVSVLKQKIKNIEIFNTICNATQKRQDSAKKMASEVDLVIVIGDKSSSNSKKLFEITRKICESIFIEEVMELKKYDLSGIETVGITAGASTPDFVINEVIEYLESGTNLSLK